MGPVLPCLPSGFWRFFHFLLPRSTLISNQAVLGPDDFHSPSQRNSSPAHKLSISSIATKRETLHEKQLRKHLGFFPGISPSQQAQLKMMTPFTNEETEKLSKNLPTVTLVRGRGRTRLPVRISLPHHRSLM